MTDTAIQANDHTQLLLQHPLTEQQQQILTADALSFIGRLVERFAERVPLLLEAREQQIGRAHV